MSHYDEVVDKCKTALRAAALGIRSRSDRARGFGPLEAAQEFR